jgi:molecular chaperone DnaJ
MNYYHVLKVDQTASQQEIKQSYRRLVKRFHPDSQTEAASHEDIIRLNAAYEVLGDPQQRDRYDQSLRGIRFGQHQAVRQAQTHQQYQQDRQASKREDAIQEQWLKSVYAPLHHQLMSLIASLDRQIDDLAADPFDDELMALFQSYLQTSRLRLEKFRRRFISFPNPASLAKLAAFLYYCLNHLEDGLDELERFTLNYDDHHLHTGKELFRLAEQLLQEKLRVV